MSAAYPDTKEKRQAGMATFRARMLAAHERALATQKLSKRDAETQRVLIDTIKAAQKRFGEAA